MIIPGRIPFRTTAAEVDLKIYRLPLFARRLSDALGREVTLAQAEYHAQMGHSPEAILMPDPTGFFNFSLDRPYYGPHRSAPVDLIETEEESGRRWQDVYASEEAYLFTVRYPDGPRLRGSSSLQDQFVNCLASEVQERLMDLGVPAGARPFFIHEGDRENLPVWKYHTNDDAIDVVVRRDDIFEVWGKLFPNTFGPFPSAAYKVVEEAA